MSLLGNITRRGLFRAGAASAATVTAVGLMAGCRHVDDPVSNPVVVDDHASDNILSEDGDYTEADLSLKEQGSWTLPTGTILRQGRDTWIPGLAEGATAIPILKAVALSTKTGELKDVITNPVMGNDPNVSIYDVRCSDKVYAWVEIDMLNRNWKLYAQRFSDGAVSGDVSSLWEGDVDWDPPLIAVAGDAVIWQVMPSATGKKSTEHSFCYLWHVGGTDAQAVVESPGRFATPPAVSDTTVTLVPRVKVDDGVFYGITAYSIADDLRTVVDQLVLPQGVKPFRAVRMGDKFAFSIEANYAEGGLLSRMGTYIGAGEGPFVTLVREPAAHVAGKENLFIIKSRASYFVVDVDKHTFSILGASNHCVDYGEFPASEGVNANFLTFTTVKDTNTGYPSAVAVRSFGL